MRSALTCILALSRAQCNASPASVLTNACATSPPMHLRLMQGTVHASPASALTSGGCDARANACATSQTNLPMHPGLVQGAVHGLPALALTNACANTTSPLIHPGLVEGAVRCIDSLDPHQCICNQLNQPSSAFCPDAGFSACLASHTPHQCMGDQPPDASLPNAGRRGAQCQ